MNERGTGPVASEMLRRLELALGPTRLQLTDDSEAHRGHGGYHPAGESHFSLSIESLLSRARAVSRGSEWSMPRSAS
jgi:BolA protein